MSRTINLGKIVPQKGTDYFTEEDKQEIITDITSSQALTDLQSQVNTLQDKIGVFDNGLYGNESGTEIEIEDGFSAPLRDMKVLGNSVQDDTPSPDYPQEIKVVTGENTIKVGGKNLFNFDYSFNRKWWNEEGNYEGYPVYIKDSAWNGLSHAPKFYNVGDVVTISLYAKASQNTSAGFYTNVNGYGENGGIKSGGSDISLTTSWQKFTFTFTVTRSGMLGPRLELRVQGVTIYVSQIQIEYGSTATSYEPYKEQIYNLNLGDIELAKIGNAQDSITYEVGKWYLNKQVGKVVLNGSEPWIKLNNNFKTSITLPNDVALRDDTEFARSNYFIYKYIPSDITTRLSNLHFSWSGVKELNIRYDGLGSVNNFTTWLQTNQPVIYYKLATPTKEEITDFELRDQLDDLVWNTKTSKDSMIRINTECEEGNTNAILDVDYVKDINKVVNQIIEMIIDMHTYTLN